MEKLLQVVKDKLSRLPDINLASYLLTKDGYLHYLIGKELTHQDIRPEILSLYQEGKTMSFKMYLFKYHPKLYKETMAERENISKPGTPDQNKTYRIVKNNKEVKCGNKRHKST